MNLKDFREAFGTLTIKNVNVGCPDGKKAIICTTSIPKRGHQSPGYVDLQLNENQIKLLIEGLESALETIQFNKG